MWCTNCGNELKDDAKFCGKCGAKVEPEYEQSIQQTQQFQTQPVLVDVFEEEEKSSKGKYIFIILIIVGLLIVGAAGIFLIKGKPKDDSENKTLDPSTPSNQSSNDEDYDDLEDLYNYFFSESEDTEQQENMAGNEDVPEEPVYDSTEGGIHRYKFFVDDCTWSEALVKARESGGYLVHINSPEEYEYIIGEIKSLGYEKIQFRIGGRRDTGSTDYYWVDENNNLYGEIINSPDYWASSEWMAGEPTFKDGEIDEDCLDFYYYEKENRWVWNDVPNDIIEIVPYYSGQIGYIVEYEE